MDDEVTPPFNVRNRAENNIEVPGDHMEGPRSNAEDLPHLHVEQIQA